ncbi:hypothetical protein N7507_001103 [Penicillium longicatenatum]|nr:hypothetical protein N7507_001103 [Penicillium longicatenatum]
MSHGHFADPGEGIFLGRPFYGTFMPDLSLRPATSLIPVSFDDLDPFSIEAVGKYEQALLEFREKTGQMIIEMMRLCQKYKMHLISDEIYALSVWDNQVDRYPHPVNIVLTDVIDSRLVLVLWGMSKDLGANGLRLGIITSQFSQTLHKALKETSLYSYASGVSEHLASLPLEDPEFTDIYIKENQKKLSQSYTYVVQYLRAHNIGYAPGCNAAFFVWVNLGEKYCQLHPELKDTKDISDTIMHMLLEKGNVLG